MESLPKLIVHFMENSGRLFESKSHLGIVYYRYCRPVAAHVHIEKCSISVMRLSDVQASMPCGKFCLMA